MRQISLKLIMAAFFLCLPLAARADVTLAWNPASGGTVTNYTVYWGTNTGVYTFDLAIGNQTSLTVTGLETNTAYYFSVQATAADGTQSAFSNEITYTNAPSLLPPAPPPPGSGTPIAGGSTNSSTNSSSLAGGGGNSGGGSGNSGGGSGNSGGSGGSGGSTDENGSTSEFSVQGIPPALTLSISNSLPLLNISGTVGATLSIQSTTNPLNPDAWSTIAEQPITNAAGSVSTNSGAPSAVSLAFVPAMQSYQVVDTNPPPGEFYRVVMPYDYMVLADSVLSAQGDPSRLILITMPGTPSSDVCYVTPQNSFLYYDQTNLAFALDPSGSTIRQIATTLSTALGQNWTSASEFAYSNGVSSILATVVETEPASSDPVAGASTPIISIDF
jgi:hypothetical protein